MALIYRFSPFNCLASAAAASGIASITRFAAPTERYALAQKLAA
jgi:hypothetical protein